MSWTVDQWLDALEPLLPKAAAEVILENLSGDKGHDLEQIECALVAWSTLAKAEE